MKSKIWILLLIFCLGGCNDFLEESSQDEVRPSTVDDMEQLLLGEVYMGEYDLISNVTNIFTDDQQCNGLINERDRYILEGNRYQFTWQKDMFDENGGGNNTNLWEIPYQRIKGCNVVIDYLDKVTGSAIKRENLKAEAYTMRAFYYLMLVNYFGLPYNYGDPEKNPGVPLKLDMNVTEDKYPRNSVAEVYRSVEKDLLEANRIYDKNRPTLTTLRAGRLMTKALLSRVYLYMEDWDNVVKYADEVLQEQSTLLDLNVLEWQQNVYSLSSGEIIWARPAYGGGKNSSFNLVPFSVSKDFIHSFDSGDWDIDEGYDEWGDDGTVYKGDLRWSVCAVWGYDDRDWSLYFERVAKSDNDGYHGIRTAEVYLNRAEAYIHKFIESGTDEFRVKALADLNHLRWHRFDRQNEGYEPVNYSDGAVLLDFYKAERRRELCDEENHRWFDLRRYGMPEIKHVFFENPGEEETFILEKNSPRYVLPIPLKVLQANTRLEQNP